MKWSKCLEKINPFVLVVTLGIFLLWPDISIARDPDDPGKGFDYVFFGFSPPLPKVKVDGSWQNRAMLLQDIDGKDKNGNQLTARFVNDQPKFKLMSESTTGSGVLETVTLRLQPNFYKLIWDQDPVRFVFAYIGDPRPGSEPPSGEQITVQSDSALEANGQHYLRSVVDLIHKGKRTRYLVDCPNAVCDEPVRPY